MTKDFFTFSRCLPLKCVSVSASLSFRGSKRQRASHFVAVSHETTFISAVSNGGVAVSVTATAKRIFVSRMRALFSLSKH